MDKTYTRINWANQPSTTTALGATNLNKMDLALNEIDNRVVDMDTSKADASVVNNTVQSITYDDETGILTITKVNGTSTNIDTKLEKLAVNFTYNPETQQLVITLDDGTVQNVDLSSLITEYEFEDSDTVSFEIVDGVITAFIHDGAITGDKLQPDYLADITVQAGIATTQANLAKRYAVGGVEEGDATDNAKYYKEQAQAAAEQAQEIAGFDPTTKLNKANADTATEGQVLTSNGDGTYEFKDPTESGGGDAADITYNDGTVEDALDEMKTHIEDGIFCEEGVHGLRWHDDKLQFFNGEEWVEIETGGGGVPPSNVINPSIQAGNGQLTIKWTDPEDTIVDGQLISTWAGTKLVRKAGSYPTNEKDGVVLVDNKVRGAYASSGYVDSGLTNGVTYYYQLFPYSDQGAVNRNEANRLSGTPQPYVIFGVAIDLTNSNPETAVTYTDDAVGMTGGAAAWDSMNIFKDIKPCVLKNGVVQYYLNPNDFTKKADGSAADITSGNDGDVMIEIPKTGFLISTVGNILTVKVTDDPNNPNFKYYAHSRATEGDRSKLYIGAYKGYKDGSNKLRSLSGKAPTVSQTIGTFRTQAQANGSGYDMLSFYPLTLIQCLYLIKYKNLDSQTALGQGYTGGSATQSTGATNTAGMCYGSTSTTSRVKLFGIEDFWGNVFEWIDGLFCDGSRYIKTAFQGFNDTGNGYTSRGQGATSDISGYMSKPQGTSEAGFIAKEVSGSSTTYFADYAYLSADCLPIFGGRWNSGADAGAFRLSVAYSASFSYSDIGARLMYL